MTISYSGEVPNGSSFGCFWRILCKWRGSVYKLVWRELLAYLFLYYSINFIYRYALNEQQQRVFEKIRAYFGTQNETIPMSFVLGFYVSLVVKRWWEQYRLLPWPDTLALYISAGIPGADERGRLMRRNIVRYAVLAYVITLQRVSLRVKRRFPTWQHVVDSGLMMESEKKIIEMMDGRSPMSKYWMPLVWATNIINRARKESLITSDHIVQTLLLELSDIRRRLGGLIGYDTVCVPLVYTQVVTLALYSYFIAALLGRQFVPSADNPKGSYEEPDMYFPFFTALQFCFYVGWLKVAEVLINPFGEDDDDIELNWLIDRHIKAAYMIVDEMHEEHPELLRDQYWEEVVPKDLPYTVASEHYRREEPKGSAELYKVKQSDAMYANLSSVNHHHVGRKLTADDMYADYESVDTPIVERRKNWFARQITRVGSVRSSSTAYSSGGLFSRGRHNSVYANPEVGQPVFGQPGATAINNNGINQPQQKISFYDRLVGRRSSRGQRQIGRQGTAKHNGSSTAMNVRNRPRIPTPDVTKEVLDHREHRFNSIGGGITTSVGGQVNPVALMAHQLNSGYTGNEVPVVQVVLSPIQEMDGSSSHNNTLHAGQPGTAALAQAVLSPALKSAGIGPVIAANLTPVTVSQLSSLGLAVTTNSNTNSPLMSRSDISQAATLPANLTITEISPTLLSELNTVTTPTNATVTEVNSDDDGNKSSGGSSSVGTDEKTISRKTSVTSQVTAPASSPKRSEVYV